MKARIPTKPLCDAEARTGGHRFILTTNEFLTFDFSASVATLATGSILGATSSGLTSIREAASTAICGTDESDENVEKENIERLRTQRAVGYAAYAWRCRFGERTPRRKVG
jgi:hypothetical protein